MKTLPSTTIYFGKEAVIVAPLHVSGDGGFTYEQPNASIVLAYPDEVALGTAVKSALQKFSIRVANLRNYKRTDWPAFRASGKKTIKSFEKDFVLMKISVLNSSGTARASVYIGEPPLALSLEFNSFLPDEEVGLCLNGLLSRYHGMATSSPSLSSSP